MKIAILSGKGGTGKTTVSVNLFSLLNDYALIDTDIEEPNAHLYIPHSAESITPITKKYPIVDSEKCTLCGKCETHCNFNAIITTKKNVMVFDDLCHDCGMCRLVCPNNAITYDRKTIGTITNATLKNRKSFSYGLLNTGEVSGVALIETLKKESFNQNNLLIDCPPGVACNTAVSIDGVDHAIIVTEPSPFGLSDMKMVVELLRNKNIPFGVVINKAGLGTFDTVSYLKEENIPYYGDILYKESRAKIYSKGELLVKKDKTYADELENIFNNVLKHHGENYA